MGKYLPNYKPVDIPNGKNRALPSFRHNRGASPVETGKLPKPKRLRHILYRGFW